MYPYVPNTTVVTQETNRTMVRRNFELLVDKCNPGEERVSVAVQQELPFDFWWERSGYQTDLGIGF